jgi:hypothetical protein
MGARECFCVGRFMDDITKQKICPVCRTPFIGSSRANQYCGSKQPHDDQLYCSSKCRQKAYRRRSGAPGAAVTAALGRRQCQMAGQCIGIKWRDGRLSDMVNYTARGKCVAVLAPKS